MRFEGKSPSLGILDGDDGLGHVVTYHACAQAVELAKESGCGGVIVQDSIHCIGLES
jgi:ureidoglycolate dehydrogenase (NAD+)